MKKLKNGFFTKGYFSVGDEREIETNEFFQDSSDLAKFIAKILYKDDDHHSKKYTGHFY